MKNLTPLTNSLFKLTAHLSLQAHRDEKAIELAQESLNQLAALSPPIQAQILAGEPEHLPLRPNDVTDFDSPDSYQIGGALKKIGIPETQAAMKGYYNRTLPFKTDIENLRAHNAMLKSEPYLEGKPPLRPITGDGKLCALDTSKLGEINLANTDRSILNRERIHHHKALPAASEPELKKARTE